MRCRTRGLGLETLELRTLLDGHLTGALVDVTTRIADLELPGDRVSITASAEQDGNLLLTVKSLGDDFRDSDLQLWKTNGSAESTEKVFQTASGFSEPRFQQTGMLVVGDRAYFVVDRWEPLFEEMFPRVVTIELWQTDGTADGTSLVTTITGLNSPTTGAYDVSLHPVNDEAFMIVLSEAPVESSDWTGSLWVSDGTADGTRAFGGRFDYSFGLPLSEPVELDGLWLIGSGYFRGPAGSEGEPGLYTIAPEQELVESIRTFVGEELEGVLGAYQLTGVGGTIYFSASDAASGYELWRTDGTADGTRMVIDIHPTRPPGCCLFGSSPRNLTNVDGTLFFDAASSEHGRELWQSDGTEAGTTIVRDLTPGTESTRFWPSTLSANGLLYFTVSNSDGSHAELWVTDGTEDGTLLLAGFDRPQGSLYVPIPRSMIEIDGTVFFSIDDGSGDAQIWKTDGTSPGTELALRITTEIEGSQPVRLIAYDHQLIFAAPESADDIGLWSINVAAQGPLTADVNGNGIVDFADFLVLSANFGQEVSGGRQDGDLDEDGSVTFEDFLILSDDFGRSIRITPAAS